MTANKATSLNEGRISPLFTGLWIALTPLVVGGCTEGDESALDGSWQMAWTYSSELQDTALLTPLWLSPFGEGVAAGDGNLPRVTAFDSDGSVRWIYAPPQGEGPGEMRFVVDAVESTEGLWLLGFPPRLVLLSHEGEFERQLSIQPPPDAIVRAMESIDAEHVRVIVGRRLARVSLIDGSLTYEDEGIPWVQDPPAGWVATTTLGVEGDVTVVGMAYGPEILVFDGGSLRAAIRRDEIPHWVRGARVDQGGGWSTLATTGVIPFGAWAVELVDSAVWVLTGGAWLGDQVGVEEPRRNDRVLVFSLDGEVMDSLRLPVDAGDLTFDGSRLYLVDRSEPRIVALERRGGS